MFLFDCVVDFFFFKIGS